MTNLMPDVIVDTSGLICPMPVLRAKKAIDILEDGQVLNLISTDRATLSDIPLLVSRLGLQLLDTVQSGGVIQFFIRRI